MPSQATQARPSFCAPNDFTKGLSVVGLVWTSAPARGFKPPCRAPEVWPSRTDWTIFSFRWGSSIILTEETRPRNLPGLLDTPPHVSAFPACWRACDSGGCAASVIVRWRCKFRHRLRKNIIRYPTSCFFKLLFVALGLVKPSENGRSSDRSNNATHSYAWSGMAFFGGVETLTRIERHAM